MKRRFIALLVAGLLTAVAILVMMRRDTPQAPTRPLSIVLVTIDTLRADRVGPELTPNIHRLATRGRSYANVRATVPLTLPSHVSLLTGTIPPLHGVRENGVVFDRQTPTLARVLKDAGYATGAFVGAYVLNRRFGLADGFDTYDDAVRRDPQRAEQLEAERRGAEVVDPAIAWVGQQREPQPFFLWVHLYDPHAPYDPPQALARGHSGYDGEVAYADAQVGRLIDAISTSGLTDSTLVVVTSDHGESLGEHGEDTHGMLLYDGALRVPLVMAGPTVAPAGDATCHQSLAATMLQLSGHVERIPPTMARAADCVPYAETHYPRRAGWHALTAVTDQRWKLIASSEQELYDLTVDPQETNDLSSTQPNVVQALAAAIARARPANERTARIAPEASERLRALGYVSGSGPASSDNRQAPNPARVIAAWTGFERALGLLQRRQPLAAVEILRPLAGKYPEAQIFHSTLGLALREAGDARAAVAVYKRAVSKWTADPALFHDLAAAAREAGAIDEAMRAEQAALALDASSAMAQNGLGLLHADAGRAVEAAAAFARATEQDPTNPSYWTNLGNARRAMDDGSGAEAAYRKALAIDQDFADALNGVGTLYVQSGRAAEAVALFERALRRDPELHEARLNLGIALQESGQLQRAAETYRQVLAKAPPSSKRERDAAASLLKSIR